MIAWTCLARTFYWKFANWGTNTATGTSRFNRTAGFIGAWKRSAELAAMPYRCVHALLVTRASQNPRTDVASYCALPAESRSTSLSDWVTECRASFIGVHFRPEKPILLGDTRWTIHLHTLSYVPSLGGVQRSVHSNLSTFRNLLAFQQWTNER